MAKTVKYSPEDIVHVTGVSSQNNSWNGFYWENRVGNSVFNLNRELKKQGFKIIAITEGKRAKRR